MEIYESRDKKIAVIVDFAHNRLSFESLFESVKKEYPDRRVSIVFGCPGNKAVIRRKDLPEVSSRYADMIYITEDDPAEENVIDICNEIAKNTSAPYKIIPDRNEAIREAVLSCEAESVVLLAGKGNEDRQKRGLESVPCPTDTENAVKYLKEYDERCSK